jgi:tRNA-specific 2-thiouridylase
VIDHRGGVLAHHQGIHRFTVGQRRGLGVAAGEPLYVRAIDAASGDVELSPRHGLTAPGLIATRINLIRPEATPDGAFQADVKIRYRHRGIPASIRLAERDRAEIHFADCGPAVTPGQACVFYWGEEVLGGGVIERALEN